jgi:hypothetical protein
MNKELSPMAMWGVIAGAVAILLVAGVIYWNRSVVVREDPELVRQQTEAELSRRPGYAMPQQPGAQPGVAAQPGMPMQAPQAGPMGGYGFSPGREAELRAREEHMAREGN